MRGLDVRMRLVGVHADVEAEMSAERTFQARLLPATPVPPPSSAVWARKSRPLSATSFSFETFVCVLKRRS